MLIWIAPSEIEIAAKRGLNREIAPRVQDRASRLAGPGRSIAKPRRSVCGIGFVLVGAAILFFRALVSASAAVAPETLEFFESKIRPVLAQDCYECHRTNGKKKGGLALDCRQALLAGGESGKVIVPGNPDASLLIQAIRHERSDLQMPKARAKLEAAVIADFEAWIRMGAPDPRDAPATDAQIAADTDWSAVMKRRKSWWSFQPIQKPDVSRLPPAGAANHPVDRFITAKLSQDGLSQSPKADRRTLIRRLSFALRGLPPSPQEIEAFVQDNRPDAYPSLVDQFLASPRFGECWARHWMDWIRYADSHGSEGDAMIPYAWRYRDYLIRALNGDVPYDQLVREQLAGDLLPHPRINPQLGLNESALGIGHLRMVFHGFAPTDALEEQLRFTDDQIGVVSKAFLGLTISCARCHNHKFDPISQKDFYGWYGIFVSCPPASIAVDAPNPQNLQRRAELAGRKKEIQTALAESWLRDVNAMARRLVQPGDDLKKAIEAAKEPTSVLHPFFVLQHSPEEAPSVKSVLSEWRDKIEQAAAHREEAYPKRWNLTQATDFATWRHDGDGAAEVSPAGAFAIAPDGDSILSGIYPAGVYSHLITSKDRGVLLSPRFALDKKYDLWLRILGDGGAVARYVVQNYPRDGSVYPVTRLSGARWRWVKLGLDYWQGDRIHIEVTTAADQPVLADVNATRSWFGISDAVITLAGQAGPPEAYQFAEPVLAAFGDHDPTNTAQLAGGFATALESAAKAWLNGKPTDGQALFLNELVQAGLLPNRLSALAELQPLVASYRKTEAALPVPTRAPGVIETEPLDQPLFVRGNTKQLGDPVPRRFLEAFDASPFANTQSGRLELAEAILRPDNPLTMRVIVNRVWHHLFGRGIVATPDNFGRMGQEPTHPELLDFLAAWFEEHGYSIKALIRFLVTSDTWQCSSAPSAIALQKDPNNELLSHFNVLRLEAEAIRDSLLSVSGDLEADEMYGPPITGGTPRRSVYMRIKRNDLDPFLAVFDAPVPASTKGRRDVTAVPAQSLTLLNDPFVLGQAEDWARRVDHAVASANSAGRIQAMFVQALGRPPTASESDRAARFLRTSETQRCRMSAELAQLSDAMAHETNRVAALLSEATRRVLSARHLTSLPPDPSVPRPLAAWDFKGGLQDRLGGLEGKSFGNAKIEQGALVVDGKASYVATAPLTRTLKAKTLEAWVQLADLNQQGGGVITIQDLSGTVFDSIVIGEKQPRHWMAGSDGYARYQDFAGPAEAEATESPVCLAIVYDEDGTITAYRNGRPYGKPYKSNGPVVFEAGRSQILFGNRHGQPVGNKSLAGKIFQARLYDRALTAAEVQASANSDPNFISEQDLLTAMSAGERQERETLLTELAQNEKKLNTLSQIKGLSSEWANLGDALFNLKEFIYVR